MSDSRMLCVDPGEMTGWSLWSGDTVLGGGQTPLWEFAHAWHEYTHYEPGDEPSDLFKAGPDNAYLRDGVDASLNQGPIDLLVYEIFALYPWKAKELSWDEFRTVQLIGVMKICADVYGVKVHKQPAAIKERAQAGGVEELYVRPLHENRHQNDSLQHGWFYRQVEVHGKRL